MRRRLNAVDLLTDLAGRFRGLLGERLHFRGHDGETPPSLTGPRRFDGRVQRQQIGLPGDGVDEFDDVTDPGGGLRQFAHAAIGPLRLVHRLAGDPRRILNLAADFVDR